METTENNSGLQGLDITGAGANKGSSQTAASGSASETVIKQRKERSDKGKSRGSGGGKSETSVPLLSQAQFAALYSPALWTKALSSPAHAMAAMTGHKAWELSEKEEEALGATGSIAAQCFAVSDPRWLALSLALVTIIDVYGVRAGVYLADKRREREEAKKREAENKK